MRALVLTNMYPDPRRPGFGRFVHDQVQAIRALGQAEVEVEVIEAGRLSAYAAAAPRLRRRFRGSHLDVVHAHFGLTAWPALGVPARVRAVTLHGTDLSHPRSRAITLAALPWLDLVATVSQELAGSIPAWALRTPVRVLPCGVDLGRFHRIDRGRARRELGLPAESPLLLFAADPRRPEKRHDRALALAEACGADLLVLGDVEPERVPLYVNSANAVVVPSEREGFGLAVLEALACDVPVLATPHGVAPVVLAGLPGALCAEFSVPAWAQAVAPHLTDPDPRIDGRGRAEEFSAAAMARRVQDAWTELLARS